MGMFDISNIQIFTFNKISRRQSKGLPFTNNHYHCLNLGEHTLCKQMHIGKGYERGTWEKGGMVTVITGHKSVRDRWTTCKSATIGMEYGFCLHQILISLMKKMATCMCCGQPTRWIPVLSQSTANVKCLDQQLLARTTVHFRAWISVPDWQPGWGLSELARLFAWIKYILIDDKKFSQKIIK